MKSTPPHIALSYINLILMLCIVSVLLLMSFSDILPVKLIYSTLCNENSEKGCENNLDAIHVAAQLGRLDFISISITILGVCLGIGAIFAFLYIKDRSEAIARQVSEEEFKRWSEKTAPRIITGEISKYREFNEGATDDKTAAEIARAVENDTEVTANGSSENERN